MPNRKLQNHLFWNRTRVRRWRCLEPDSKVFTAKRSRYNKQNGRENWFSYINIFSISIVIYFSLYMRYLLLFSRKKNGNLFINITDASSFFLIYSLFILESVNFFFNRKQKWFILIYEMIGNPNATYNNKDLYISFFESKIIVREIQLEWHSVFRRSALAQISVIIQPKIVNTWNVFVLHSTLACQ
jgi:hypothetical protein